MAHNQENGYQTMGEAALCKVEYTTYTRGTLQVQEGQDVQQRHCEADLYTRAMC